MRGDTVERKRILVVDDDRSLGEMLGEYLERAGYVVSSQETVAEGFAAARREAFDAVILDVMLPDGDGLDLCRAPARGVRRAHPDAHTRGGIRRTGSWV